MKRKHIAINALCVDNQRAGISNYTVEIASRLATFAATSPDVRLTVFVPSFSAAAFKEMHGAALCVIFMRKSLPLRIIAEQIIVPLLCIVKRISVLHSPSNVASVLLPPWIRSVLTVHDIYYKHEPQRFGFAKNFYLTHGVGISAARASRIMCDSEATLNDMAHFYRVPRCKMETVYLGYDAISSAAPLSCDDELQQIGVSGSFYLFVGTLEPGKNLLNLFKAYALRSRSDDNAPQLVVVGKKGWGYESALAFREELGLQKKIILAGFISAELLEHLYRHAAAVVLPSFFEGFGLPIVEAQSRDCPVCCSNSSCLPEVAGEGALLFNPADPASIADALGRVVDGEVRRDLVEKGRKNIARFSWDAAARRVWENLLVL